MPERYDKGFTTTVDGDGDVFVKSEHYSEYVWQQRPFPVGGRRSLASIRRAVERKKRYLARKEERLAALKEEFDA